MRNVTTILRNAAGFIKHHGLIGFCRELRHRVVNDCYERRLGIETTGRVKLADLGIQRGDSRDSMPIGYVEFFAVLKRVPLHPSDVTFLDFGAGKGRAVCAAATLPFKRVIGIEVSQALFDVAVANVARMRHRKAREVDVKNSDATEYQLPDDVNLVYFFNPFAGDSLRKVVDNIYASAARAPRKIYVVFFNNDHFETIVAHRPWIRKISQTVFYPRISCGMYEAAFARAGG